MTQEELRVKLATDPNFIFSYIYGNNPDAVIANLRGLGFLVNNDDDVFTSINELIERGDDDLLQQAFGVAIITDGLDPRELAAIQDVLSAQAQAVHGGPMKKLEMSTEAWVGIAGLAVGLIGALAGKPVQQTGQGGAAATQPQPPKKDNTLTLVLLGVGGLVVVVLLIMLLKK